MRITTQRRGLSMWSGVAVPALRAGQAFGYATLSEIGVVIRDTGAFLDPRSRKDWWQ